MKESTIKRRRKLIDLDVAADLFNARINRCLMLSAGDVYLEPELRKLRSDFLRFKERVNDIVES